MVARRILSDISLSLHEVFSSQGPLETLPVPYNRDGHGIAFTMFMETGDNGKGLFPFLYPYPSSIPVSMNNLVPTITHCLKSARLLPVQPVSFMDRLNGLIGPGFRRIDLLPLLVQQWQATSRQHDARSSKNNSDTRLKLLEQSMSRGARLLLDAGSYFGKGFQQWLGWRLCWSPGRLPDGQLVGIASSRLGRKLDEKPSWFQTLRHYCHQLDPEKQVLLTVTATAAAPYVTRAAALFKLPCLQTRIIDSSRWRYWGKLVWNSCSRIPTSSSWSAIISPRMQFVEFPHQFNKLENTPARDRTLVSGSSEVWICQLRSRGVLHNLVTARLTCPWSPPNSILTQPRPGLESSSNLTAPVTMIRSHCHATDIAPKPQQRTTPNICHIHETTLLHSPWEYLSHWTRRQDGPWPDQDHDRWLDTLILQQPDRHRSALMSLHRIVRQQQLIGTNSSIRGRYQVVSFTASPLIRWDSLRTYRPHRGRWDFEPYGICLQRRWLERRGAQPVIYGNDYDWKHLTKNQRPFFQHRFGNASSRAPRWDWSIEEEWRYPGTLSLEKLPPEAGFLFVPTRWHAAQLATYSPWPIIYLERNSENT